MNNCLICDGKTTAHGRARMRETHETVLQRCLDCGFIFAPEPGWLAEAYAEPINASDTGYLFRNLAAREHVRYFIESFLDPAGEYLDYAAGYGVLVRLMRDNGYDFRWFDLYCPNLFSRGFEAPQPLAGPFEAVTAFEVFEHLTNPRGEMRTLAALTDCLIFSTMLLPEPAPALESWWYFGFEHGQHVSFYTRKSLELLAAAYGYRFATNGRDLHVFSRAPLPVKIPLLPPGRWRRWALYLQGKRPRPPLTFSDHDLIVARLKEEKK